MRLAMLLVVRDEADLIEEWVRFHASLDVDCFFVTDHGSRDGTYEALLQLTREYEIHIQRREDPVMYQARWMTDMALWARERHGADWLVLSDADEFWLPSEGSLADALKDADADVATCRRTNMLGDREMIEARGYRFFHNVWRVDLPFPAHAARPNPDECLDSPLFLRSLPAKVACSARGLSGVHFGNHDVVHSEARRTEAAIEILHFPVRRYEQFASQTADHGAAIARDETAVGERSWHQRRLHARLLRGEMAQVYEELLEQVDFYRQPSQGRLVEDLRLWECLSPQTLPAIGGEAASSKPASLRPRVSS